MSRLYDFTFASGKTDPGKSRDKNEDALLLMPEAGGFFIADGVGGSSFGEKASKMIMEQLQQQLESAAEASPGRRKFLVDKALHLANKMIREYAATHICRSMGSTVAGVLLDAWNPSQIWICHVGDSRIYLIRDGMIAQLTNDHVVIDEETGKSKLARAIGAKDTLDVEWNMLDVQANDIILLNTDGLTLYMNNDQLLNFIQSPSNVGMPLPEGLIEEALRLGGKDNVTVISLKLKSVLPPADDMSEEEVKESEQWATREITAEYLANSSSSHEQK